MKQLGIIDSAFTNLEHPNAPQHVGGLGIYDPSTAPDGFVRFKQVLDNFEERLKKVSLFRTRLVEVPLGLDRPYFVIDKNFDVEFHIRHIALPKPGDWRQLCIQVARLHSRPLDMTRPLWECYVIEGLDNVPGVAPGGFAVYTKMHHCLVDGAGGQDFMTVLHDLKPNPDPVEDGEAKEIIAQTQPSDMGLIGRAVLNKVKGLPTDIRSFFSLGSDLLRTAINMRRGELPKFTAGGPKSRFDEPVGPHRVYDALTFDLDEIKAIKDKAGTTINDVLITVVAGALREYFLAKDELPEDPLALGMPVNMRSRKGETEDANQIGTIVAEVHTDIADPKKRLYAIQESITAAKQLIDTPFVDLTKIAGYFSPMISKRAAKLYADSELTRFLPIGNCGIVTNIVGAPIQLYCAGAKLTNYHVVGLLTAGCGLCHAAFTMNNEMSLSFLADRDAMPDPEFYRQCVENSYAALKDAVLAVPQEAATKSAPSAKAAIPIREVSSGNGQGQADATT